MTPFTISTEPASENQVTAAIGVVIVLVALIAAALGVASDPGPFIPAFVPIFLTLIATMDGLTAILLLSQGRVSGDRALVVVAMAYLFAGCMAFAQIITFPGVLSETGLFAGPQSSVWLWVFWHASFPILLIISALMSRETPEHIDQWAFQNFRRRLTILVLALACLALYIVTHYADDLPILITKGTYTELIRSGIGGVIWLVNVAALVTIVYRTKLKSIGALWLSVAMVAFLLDVSMTLLSGGRFTIGWYFGRVGSVLSATIVFAVMMTKVIRLVTTSAALNESLAEARQSALDALEARTNFLAAMSHEIRTPMNGVISVAVLLEQTKMTEDQRSLVGVIRSSSQSLLTIIGDLLDFSKLEVGRLDLETIGFSLVDVAEDAVELMTGRAEEKRLTLVLDIEPSVPTALLGDPSRLRQIFLNLIGNAVKFTDAGSVTLRIRQNGVFADGRVTIRFECIDTGIGLTEEAKDLLFQPYRQAEASINRRFGGSGLGLAISRRLCHLMGGQIDVDSSPGSGSTFWWEIPFAPDPAAEPGDTPDLSGAAIVVAGVPAEARIAFDHRLQAIGVTDIAHADFPDIADAARTIAPGKRCVVLIARPSGAVRDLVAGGFLAALDARVILIASRSVISKLDDRTRAHFSATLFWPPRRQKLRLAIAAALGIDVHMRQDETVLAPDLGWQPPAIEVARAANAVVLVAEDNSINQLVISRFLGQLGYAHEIVSDGVEALERLAQERFGLLLTDLQMPRLDGFGLTAAIRGRETAGIERLPIVALTADAIAGTADTCRAALMDGYLVKPVDVAALTAVLHTHMPQGQALRLPNAASADSDRPASGDIDPQILDLSTIIQAYGGLTGPARGLIEQFGLQVPAMVDRVVTTITAADPTAARLAAHALRGSALSVGAKSLGRLAGDIEECLVSNDRQAAEELTSVLPEVSNRFLAAARSL
jgi:signal transduction histidine kinase/FixJ family two-component response regulator/HPt (histidine-containing phosphotransfer) domain-containing protein